MILLKIKYIVYLYAASSGLAIIMDSKWKRPSPKYIKQSASEIFGEVHPKISPGDNGFS